MQTLSLPSLPPSRTRTHNVLACMMYQYVGSWKASDDFQTPGSKLAMYLIQHLLQKTCLERELVLETENYRELFKKNFLRENFTPVSSSLLNFFLLFIKLLLVKIMVSIQNVPVFELLFY